MNGQGPPSDPGGRALPWTTLLAAGLAAAIAFVGAFALARAASDGDARPAARIGPLEAPARQARVRDLERAGRIPELRLSSRSGGRGAAARSPTRAEPRGTRPAAARSRHRRSGGGSRPEPAPDQPAPDPSHPPEPPPTDPDPPAQ